MDLNCTFHLTFREFNGIYGEFIYYYNRNMFCEQDVVKNSAKLTRNICDEVLFCNKAGPRPATLLKMRHQHKCLPLNFLNLFRKAFSKNTFEWLIYLVTVFPHAQDTKAYPNSRLKVFKLTLRSTQFMQDQNWTYTRLISALNLNCRRIVWVCLAILRDWRLKG